MGVNIENMSIIEQIFVDFAKKIEGSVWPANFLGVMQKSLNITIFNAVALSSGIASAATDTRNYCGTTCLSHSEVVHFHTARNTTFEMNQQKKVALINMENKIKKLGKNRGLVACVAGHTDSDASDEYNYDLSIRRARNIRHTMRGFGLATGIPINLKGYGESLPIAPNTTEQGKAQNRRVVVQYGYNVRPGEKCIKSGIGDTLTKGTIGTGGAAIAFGLLAAGAATAASGGGTTGTTP